MPFNFLKYLQPTHYFRLYTKNRATVFPLVSSLPESILEQLVEDTAYETEIARDYDLSWQAVQAGYVGSAKTYSRFEIVSVRDNYHFIRKQFHPIWVFYVLVMRLVTLHHPLRDIQAWLRTSSIKNQNNNIKPIAYTPWQSYESTLIAQQSLVSVVIPTLNRYVYLNDVLEDLEKQDYHNFEVIIVDQSIPFQPEFYNDFDLEIRVIRQEEKALWLARNRAIKEAKGDYLLLFDDDSRVAVNWISNHLKCLDYFKANVSSGVSISQVGAKVPKNYSYFRLSDQLDTGNVLIKKEVFEHVGLFDRQFEKQRMGDGEFGLRCYLAGVLNVSNPYSERLHLKVGTGGLREMGSWDAFRPSTIFAPRPIPSVLYFYRKYYGNAAARWSLLRTIPLSIMPYQFKKNKPMLVIGALLSILLMPVVVVQVWRSWRLASVKLGEGARIERL
ncbi:glycosyltransferase family 2 protein [Gelidibacter sp. DF109]|uniref:Glycosyltransferase family 2 protein n=1 Tax=Gelidibacter pelagius TaxID=2819985 RepID=A0ABS3SW07_9FLAO|nr:glycosyltransferase family A protein [Gelidibacter pelagius]MBO3099899.1 glycosyltransferase family 2 protein [Gelidibacter pelagius]